MRRGVRAVALVVLLTSCTGEPAPDSGASPSLEASPTDVAAPPDEALRMPAPSPWSFPEGARPDHPRSGTARLGRPYPFLLYTHCGVGFRVDFDGSFWQAYAVLGRASNPAQRGTMTLLSEYVALFEARHGDVRIYFVRNDTPKPRLGCD